MPARAAALRPDGITPYLGLRSRLSQVWINRWTILLLLVLARCLLAVSSIQSDMASAKREALSACTSVESMGSAMASMPHYMSQGVNQLTAKGVDDAVNGLMSMLTLSVTAVEAIVIFVLKVMYQTYLCLITLAVRGSVEVAVSLLEDASKFFNKTAASIATDISNSASTFENDLNSFLSKINNGIAGIFGGGVSVPKLDLSGPINELHHIQLPASINQDLNTLNSSLPTFNQVETFIENIIRIPFQDIKALINESMGTYSFDSSVLPVPAKKQLTFCSNNDGINQFFANVTDLLITARKIFIGVLVVAATLACIPMAWREIRRWRTMKERSQLVRKGAHDPMDVVYIVSRPFTATAGIKAASWFGNSRRQILVRWVVAYATSMPALFVLSLGLAGLFSCLCQYLLVRAVDATVPELTSQVTAFADQIVASLNNASAEWANDANGVITTMDTNINHDLFGWVNTSTTALNNTLNAFVNETTNVLNETLGNTILYHPLLDVFNCLIGLKIQGIESGLTWVHDHAHVNFPLLPNDTFSLGASRSIAGANTNPSDSFLANPGSQASNRISEVVVQVVDRLEHGILTEAIISACLVLLWAFIALCAILRALTLFWRPGKHRGEGYEDVPLGAVPGSQHVAKTHLLDDQVPGAPAPAAAAAAAVSDSTDSRFENEKVGFAGQRSLNVRHAAGAASAAPAGASSAPRESTYVEFGYGDKR